jgi:hypothetical protein
MVVNTMKKLSSHPRSLHDQTLELQYHITQYIYLDKI